MYPTKTQILSKKPKISKKIIDITNSWKKVFITDWKETPKANKLERLEYLIQAINATSSKNYIEVQIEKGHTDSYNPEPKKETITLNQDNPSIISALHELGHHLYGANELTACRWSVWLFKTCFPEAYKKLSWEGHLLKK